jgi:Na+/H+-dicarboxylate symporter
MLIAIPVGLALGERAAMFELPARVILQLLGALAPPLILVAVTHALMTTAIPGTTAGRLAFLLLLNTVMAIVIGLVVANLVQPGRLGPQLKAPEPAEKAVNAAPSPVSIVVQSVPKSIFGSLGDQTNIIGVIIIAVAFGIALRGMSARPINNVQDIVEVAYAALLVLLHWIIQIVPIGVFAIVARIVGTQGFGPFASLGAFVVAVLLALLLQLGWYLARIRLFSWARPLNVLRGMRDALVMAFSTASSTATMPVTYARLKDNVGLSERSASLGGLVGANFNNDGTALYEAMAALFIAQMLGMDLTLAQQLMVVLTSIFASVGAAGIPEAGLVTMTLVFTAVGLPVEYIALLLTVDWFLDRCRTTINVMGDVNVACILDGRKRTTTPNLPAVVESGTSSPG